MLVFPRKYKKFCFFGESIITFGWVKNLGRLGGSIYNYNRYRNTSKAQSVVVLTKYISAWGIRSRKGTWHKCYHKERMLFSKGFQNKLLQRKEP